MLPNIPGIVVDIETPVSKKTSSPSLLSLEMDIAMAGGISLIAFVICMLFFDKSALPLTYIGVFPNGQILANPTLSEISWMMFYLNFVCNFPHFILSYQLLYWDYGKRVLKERSYLWAGVIVPMLLIGSMVYIISFKPQFNPFFIRLMFFLVGWHYVKQVFGIFIFSSALSRVFYSKFEKEVLRWSLLSLAVLTWLASNTLPISVNFYGFSYVSYTLPGWTMILSYGLTAIGFLWFGVLLLLRYVKSGDLPPKSSIIALISMLVWFVPILAHPVYFYMIPFFHSLQYLWFAVAFRKNKVSDVLRDKEGPEFRARYLISFWGYCLASVVIGALVFNIGPYFLDRRFPFDVQNPLHPQLFMAMSAVFLNIHHYFIDSVIWRKDNPELGKYLLGREVPDTSQGFVRNSR